MTMDYGFFIKSPTVGVPATLIECPNGHVTVNTERGWRSVYSVHRKSGDFDRYVFCNPSHAGSIEPHTAECPRCNSEWRERHQT